MSEGETGVFVPPADPAALAAALVGLLGDPARRLEMGKRGRADVERRFNKDAVNHVMEEILAEAAP